MTGMHDIVTLTSRDNKHEIDKQPLSLDGSYNSGE